MSDFQTNAGATFSVSAAAPATFDEAGYEALTFTPATAAEITEYQGPNPEWDTVSDNSYSTDAKSEQKTGLQLGSGAVNLRYKKVNTAFWDIIDAAFLDKDAVLSVQYAHSNGVDLRFYTIQVSKAGEVQGGVNDWLMREISMIFKTNVVKGTVGTV